MAEVKTFFIDTSKCLPCRACQIACKMWNAPLGTKGTKTVQRGNHQNPENLSFSTYKLVRFNELVENGRVKWYFFPDQCRHCIDPPCMAVAESLGYKNITKDKTTGAVLYNPGIKVKLSDAKAIRESCPWDIPMVNEKTGIMAKCTMCFNRITNGLLPACVKVCPTGAMNFGDRDKMLDMAHKRLKELKAVYPRAELLNPDFHQAVFLVIDDPLKYWKNAANNVTGITRLAALKKIIKPSLNFSKPAG